ncbi:hypothetical protein [Sphingomonas sp.]|uniref:hypothetical protein n=1 Tax=Sphingomonas sp. TaxID=28214 RepID=UPI001B0DF98C|nr:hypothetical protein [Sphingomonas sp.]MBO9714285.1 hypothetical protein [Sphingomonas sp.]
MMFALMLAAAPAEPLAKCPVSAHWRDGLVDTRKMVITPLSNVIDVNDDKLFWNGKPVEFDTLVGYGTEVAKLRPRPWIKIDASGADCTTLTKVMEAFGDAAACTPEACMVSRKAIPEGERH